MRYILFIIAIINIGFIQAKLNNIDELPIGLTEHEKNNINIIYEMGRETDPPIAPIRNIAEFERMSGCLLYTSPSPRDLSTSRMPSSA